MLLWVVKTAHQQGSLSYNRFQINSSQLTKKKKKSNPFTHHKFVMLHYLIVKMLWDVKAQVEKLPCCCAQILPQSKYHNSPIYPTQKVYFRYKFTCYS